MRRFLPWCVVLCISLTRCSGCNACPTGYYEISIVDTPESDVVVDAVTEGYLWEEWVIDFIGGHINADDRDRFYILLRPEDCWQEYLTLVVVVTTGGDIRPERLAFTTTPDGCSYSQERMEWDQVSFYGSMEYSIEHEDEWMGYVTFQFTDFEIVLDGIESVDPPKFSSVTLNGTYRVSMYRPACG